MRYKFRAYHKKKELLVDVLEINFMNKTIHLPIETDDAGDYYWWDSTTWDLDEVELMQFTGLTDKNGREIYEGDIVRVDKFRYSTDHQPTDIIREVGFYYGAFTLSKKGLLDFPISEVLLEQTEVIGNIYEDKYLLKETNL